MKQQVQSQRGNKTPGHLITYVIKAEARRWLVGSITLKELRAADSIRAIGCPSFILSVLENPFKLKTDLRLGIPSLGTGDVCH